MVCSFSSLKILVLGGTRFVGKALVSSLLNRGYEITLFNRGTRSHPSNVSHIKGDRTSNEDLAKLKGSDFDVIVDTSGRQSEDTERVLAFTGPPKYRLLYVSSAGVYSNSTLWPLNEESLIDKKSRHYGKAETEKWLNSNGVEFTSFRPTYIYGKGNYNPIERWFFERIVNEKKLPLPNNGEWITQLGHVNDLAEAMTISLDYKIASNRIYNISGTMGVTFRGLVEKTAIACGKEPDDIDFIYYDPKMLDSKARKLFPLRIGHFLTDTTRIQKELDWHPKIDLDLGLKDSYNNDYMLNPTKINDLPDDLSIIRSLDNH